MESERRIAEAQAGAAGPQFFAVNYTTSLGRGRIQIGLQTKKKNKFYLQSRKSPLSAPCNLESFVLQALRKYHRLNVKHESTVQELVNKTKALVHCYKGIHLVKFANV